MNSAIGGRDRVDRPVQRELDGDFTLAEIIARVGLPPTVDPAAHTPAMSPPHGEPKDELAQLHAFETSPMCRPPIATAIQGLTAGEAQEWLDQAQRWIRISDRTDDLRFLNGACKLIGAVWIQFSATTRDRRGHGWSALALALSVSTDMLAAATRSLSGRLRNRIVVQMPTAVATTAGELAAEPFWGQAPPAGAVIAHREPSVVVLAGSGSGGARRFLSAALDSQLPVRAVCWYEPGITAPSGSSYADAWYPAEPLPATAARSAPAQERLPGGPEEDTAGTWSAVSQSLRHHQADLVILIGMPIVPATVLTIATLGVVNAHNGALPGYRGMDAVGWAVLNNEPVVCTLHLASPAVDRGDVLSAVPTPFAPAGTLRARVKAAQLELLLLVARFVVATGRLPDGTHQREGRQFYRLHPHMKRILDESSTRWSSSSNPSIAAHQRS